MIHEAGSSDGYREAVLSRVRARIEEWPALASVILVLVCAYAPWHEPGDYFFLIHRALWDPDQGGVVVPLVLAAGVALLVAMGAKNGVRRRAAFLATLGLVAAGVTLVVARVPLGGGLLLIVAWRTARIYVSEEARQR